MDAEASHPHWAVELLAQSQFEEPITRAIVKVPAAVACGMAQATQPQTRFAFSPRRAVRKPTATAFRRNAPDGTLEIVRYDVATPEDIKGLMDRRPSVMLTVDHIVEKYRSLGSEATIAENLRRHGMSAEGIKESLAQRREHAGTPAEREQRIEGYRADLMKRPRAEQITAYLSLFGSHERSILLWEAAADEPADVFWQVFLENWCICDGLWPMRQIILSTLRRRVAALSPIEFLTTVDRHFYDRLPDLVTVFRGCGRRRVRGLPWTTDPAIAEKFARGGRFPQPPDPVIASAEIAKADLFFVSVTRQESEVVLDPYLIKRLRLESVLTGTAQGGLHPVRLTPA